MKRLSFVSCALGCVLSFSGEVNRASADGTAGAITSASQTARAEELLKSAFDAAKAGDQARRKELLEQAVKADPDFAQARWQLGQVKFEGQWRTPSQVGETVTSHPRWKEYRELRQQATNVADHVRLAQWCMRNNMPAEERFHWAVVLLTNPNHPQARQRLSVREFHGRLFTEKQVADYEKQQKEAKANLQKYKPQFIELCRQVRGESAQQRATALEKISAVSDVGAIAALKEAIGRKDADPADPRTKELQLAFVKALANMPEYEATLHLLSVTVSSTDEDIRKAAAVALKPRKNTDYVPMLMAALSTPLEAEFDVVSAPGGTVRLVETIYQQGPISKVAGVRSTNFEVENVMNRDTTKANPSQVQQGHLAIAASRASNTEQSVESANAEAAQRNARIQEVLKIAAGMDFGAEPEKLWAAWKEENELQYTPAPVSYTYEVENYTYRYAPNPYRYYYTKGGANSTATPVRFQYPTPVTQASRVTNTLSFAGGHASCFAPGTPVWTKAGPIAIEQITAGEMVLSQNPATGELDYRPVLQTTFGEPTKVMQLKIADDVIATTLGHRFWVEGRGWEMAKALRPDMTVHAADRGLTVAAIEASGELIACHNLVVDEFHTFFVGKSKILVHDINCPQPVVTTVVGATAKLKARPISMAGSSGR
jgi:hypothetical protein